MHLLIKSENFYYAKVGETRAKSKIINDDMNINIIYFADDINIRIFAV